MIPGKFSGRLLPEIGRATAEGMDTGQGETDPGHIFFFDDGRAITFPDASHHTMVLGTTGSGKTTGIMLPAIRSLIAAGFPGLILDIKGNLTDDVRGLAASLGRLGDVVELGTGPEAETLNLLKGLDDVQTQEMLSGLALKGGMGRSQNVSWYLNGIRIGVDLAAMCRILARQEPGLEPTLGLLDLLLNDYGLCSDLFEALGRTMDDEAERALHKSITQDSFHPCHWRRTVESGEGNPKTYLEQLEWTVRALRNGLREFVRTPGAVRGFSEGGRPNVDLARLVHAENRIVILRFGPESGATGTGLARHCLENYYRAVFTHGLSLPRGRWTFMVADEFQELACFNPENRWNDIAFLSKSREYRNIFLAGTQSLSSLSGRGGTQADVEALVSNCNNLILLYSADPWSQTLASRYDITTELAWLKPSEAMFVHYDYDGRRHSRGLAKIGNAYLLGQKWLADGRRALALAPAPPPREAPLGIPASARISALAGSLGKPADLPLPPEPPVFPERAKARPEGERQAPGISAKAGRANLMASHNRRKGGLDLVGENDLENARIDHWYRQGLDRDSGELLDLFQADRKAGEAMGKTALEETADRDPQEEREWVQEGDPFPVEATPPAAQEEGVPKDKDKAAKGGEEK